jgi:predicted nucleotidyltransferase
MCRLTNVKKTLDEIVPDDWQVLVFGSTARCRFDAYGCTSEKNGSDIDLLIVYPRRRVQKSLQVRQWIVTALGKRGIVADVVLLNDSEHSESNFTQREGAVSLTEVPSCQPGDTPAVPWLS